jgi:hypothetical protein
MAAVVELQQRAAGKFQERFVDQCGRRQRGARAVQRGLSRGDAREFDINQRERALGGRGIAVAGIA